MSLTLQAISKCWVEKSFGKQFSKTSRMAVSECLIALLLGKKGKKYNRRPLWWKICWKSLKITFLTQFHTWASKLSSARAVQRCTKMKKIMKIKRIISFSFEVRWGSVLISHPLTCSAFWVLQLRQPSAGRTCAFHPDCVMWGKLEDLSESLLRTLF